MRKKTTRPPTASTTTRDAESLIAAKNGEEGSDLAQTHGPVRRAAGRLLRQRTAVAALIVLGLLVFVAIAGDLISPHDPNHQNLLARNAGPTAAHLLGTDDLGRDILSRLIAGAGVTLLAPIIAVGVGVAIGLPCGLLAGYFRGALDWCATRLADALFAVPGILLAMAIVAIRGPSTINVMVAVGILFAPRVFRVIRAEVLMIRTATFVDAARTMGAAPQRILLQNILPNVASTLIVQCTILLGMGVLIEAALSFFGIGVQPPQASWGVVLRRSFDSLNEAPLQSIAPGVAITVLVLAFMYLGDGIRDSIGKEQRIVSW